MAIDERLLAAARAAFPSSGAAVPLGAIVAGGDCHAEPLVAISLRMFNRHGLIAGATGTGKTKTLQVLTERLSAAGVPVFVSDVKGDLSGLAVPGEPTARIDERVKQIGGTWQPRGVPVEFLSLTGGLGAQLRATVSSFGPLALAKTLDLNDTQSSVLAMVFKYCDDKALPLLDFADLRTVLQYLSEDGADELKGYGGMSKASVGVLLREMVQLEQQGAGSFFGEPEFDVHDLLVANGNEGRVNVLSLSDMQDKPALYSTFMMWMLARLYHDLPEIGDVDKPKLVFFIDEAHLLFKGASKAFLEQVEQVVRLIRSKGVGIFFITQSPKDIPPNVLGQLGNRIQHALRAFTADDDKALKAAARTFPKTTFYDIQETLTTLGIGEAFVTVLSDNGAPTQPFITRVAPPASRMGPLTPDELKARLATEQVRRYANAVDRDSAHEMLSRRMQTHPEPEVASERAPDAPIATEPPGRSWGDMLNSPLARTIAGNVTRGLMGALLGKAPARRRSRRY
jgi:DNA helicase HerA-like ATPase